MNKWKRKKAKERRKLEVIIWLKHYSTKSKKMSQMEVLNTIPEEEERAQHSASSVPSSLSTS